MEFSILDGFFKFRDKCICGSSISKINFIYSSYQDKHIKILPKQYIINNRAIFTFYMESNQYPFEQVNFDIICNLETNDFIIKPNSSYLYGFIVRNFETTIQDYVNIRIRKECCNFYCLYKYQMISCQLVFDLDRLKYSPIKISEEVFDIDDYMFFSNFKENITRIQNSIDSNKFSFEEIFNLPADKFIRYLLDAEILKNKLKNWLLFL